MDTILYEDNHLLIVNKRSGQLSQGDHTQDDAIAEEYKSYIKEKYDKPGNVFLHPTHRLDRPVSGCVILARTSKALLRLTIAFREGRVEKHYLALSNIESSDLSGTLINYLDKDSRKNKVRVVSKGRGKYAELEYERIIPNGGKDQLPESRTKAPDGRVNVFRKPPPNPLQRGTTSTYLYHIRPKTGRSHQIRVQLAHMGVPIIGDLKYGGQEWRYRKAIALHCYAMKFEHPTKKEMMTVQVDPPSYWNQYFDQELISSVQI